jgi:hypothetical protein
MIKLWAFASEKHFSITMIIAGGVISGALFLLGIGLLLSCLNEMRAADRRKSWAKMSAIVVDCRTESHFSAGDSTTPLEYTSVLVYKYIVHGIEYTGEIAGGMLRVADTAAAAKRLEGSPEKGREIPILVDPHNPRDSHYASESRASPVSSVLMSIGFILGSVAMGYFTLKLLRH